tara:strand:+ start:385 stop:1017 length:633 start_codon:yes stop_codon:yes gene_type:complete
MSDKKDKICTVILTGGLSTRMGGGIKSLTKFNKKTIFDRIIEKINNQCKYTIINSNKNNKELNKYKLPIIKDVLSGYLGPLAGIHASFYWIKLNIPKIDWLVTVPCDTPFLPDDLVKKLILKAKKNKKDIVFAKSNNRTHPVIGIWKCNASLFLNLEKKLLEGTRKIMYWAKDHAFDTEDFDHELFDPFFNINSKEDLKKAKEIEDKYLL